MTTDPCGLVVGSCLDAMPVCPRESVHLLFADPPFNIGYEYDQHDDSMTREDYLAFADRWLCEAVRLLTPHGTLWLAIGDEYAAEYKVRLDSLGLTMRNWCIWHYTFGTHQKYKFGRSKTHLLYYTRHRKRFTFNADEIRIESERQRLGDKRANPKGRVPPDVWTFSRLCGNFHERTGHPCQMPELVLDRIIRACSNPGELVFDPFAGSGTTLAVAQKLGRRWAGVELSEAYAVGIHERLGTVAA